MQYEKVNIVTFRGLNANTQADLIDDHSAADIENLRFDKQGYLINRNGVSMRRMYMQRTVFSDLHADLYPIGAMGITEYKIEDPFGIDAVVDGKEPYDDTTLGGVTVASESDRFMVYMFRLPVNDGDYITDAYNTQDNVGAPTEGSTWRFKAAVVLSPLQGKTTWRDVLFFGPNGVPEVGGGPDNSVSDLYATVGSRMVFKADGKVARLQMYAPVRWMGKHNETVLPDGTSKDFNWIEHYVDMRQYRKGVVISDRTNGDMFLVDEAQEAEYDDDNRHYFALRENAVVEFDVDDVVIDFGQDASGFNDGVLAPMALYKFYPPRRQAVGTRDNYTPYYTARVDKSPTLEQAWLGEVVVAPSSDSIVSLWRMKPAVNSFMLTDYWHDIDDDLHVAGMAINGDKSYVFSMLPSGTEIDDLFGTLSLKNPNSETDVDDAADVELWDEVEINYYPCGGIDELTRFLRYKDRTWDKSSSGGTKALRLRTMAGVEQEVPLGVWRYRFVWYMGNGEYSAASSELVVPDALFSGLTDTDITDALGAYRRPFGMDEELDSLKTGLEIGTSPTDEFFNDSADAQGIKIFQGTTPTAFGENFLFLKEKLFEPDHVFGAYYSSTSGASWPTDWTVEDILALGQVQVQATVFFTDDVGTFQGTAMETGKTITAGMYGGIGEGELEFEDYNDIEFRSFEATGIPLAIPLFAPQVDIDEESYRYNSLFTKYGVPRTVYQNSPRNSGLTGYNAAVPSYQIVSQGWSTFGAWSDTTDVKNAVANGDSIYVNVVPLQIPEEENNSPDDEVYSARERYERRNMTIVRGVRGERERLLNLKSDVPASVAERIVVRGTGEFTVAENGDMGAWEPQMYNVLTSGVNRFLHATARGVVDMDSPVRWIFEGTYAHSTAPDYTYYFAGPVTFTPSKSTADFYNVQIVVSGKGERLALAEQLSAYFPASLLFGAPRVRLVIPADRVPRRAKKLLIFRTLASHDNDWLPTNYGLVEMVDLIRDDVGDLTGDHATEVEFLDDVHNDDLDFSFDLGQYEAFTKPIRSRFNLPLNERVYYANFIETYRPRKPRNAVEIDPWDEGEMSPDPLNLPHRNENYPAEHPEMVRLWTWKMFEDDTATTNIPSGATYLYYFLAYQDAARALSLAAYSGEIDRSAGTTLDPTKSKAVLICAPSQYDAIVDDLSVYRLATTSPLTTIRMNGSSTVAAPTDKVYLVVQGTVEYHGEVYFPKDIIVTGTNRDSGVPVGLYDMFVNSFTGTGTYRGHHGSYNDPILLDITDHMTGGAGPYIERIGTLTPDMEGVFYDDDLLSTGRLSLRQLLPTEERLESGVRWSEPYEPNKIKLESLVEARSGDGDQITGLASNYGNLLVFKERSIHRLTVQGAGVPISRTDEVSNIIGCIAPNTILSLNDAVYFLSWSGFYRYNNNRLEKADGPFAEELLLRLRQSILDQPNAAIRDASCAWNPTYREIYLNLPLMTADVDENGNSSIIYDNLNTRTIRGIVYAINVDTGDVSKYRYMDDARYFTDPENYAGSTDVTPVRAPRVQSRLYYTNSIGQLRSAEVFPGRLIDHLTPDTPTTLNESRYYLHSGVFIESPTRDDVGNVERYVDDYFIYEDDVTAYGSTAVNIDARYVHTFWKSKAFTGGDKTVLKRVDKVFTYFKQSSEPIVIRGRTHTSPEGATATVDIEWQRNYTLTGLPTTPAVGELLARPTLNAGASTSPSQSRGERYEYELEAGGRVQIENFGFYWVVINAYER